MIIGDNSEWVCRWVAEQLGMPDAFQHRAYGIQIIHKDQPVAGVVYHDYTEHNCFISIATTSPYWASRLTLQAIFGYPFNQMGVNRVSVMVRGDDPKRKDNRAARKWRKTIQNRFGFVFEGRLDDYFGEGYHAHLYRMKRSECKWIGHEQGRRRQRAAV